MNEQSSNQRRRLLKVVTVGIGTVGAAAVAFPLVRSMAPSARAKAAGAPVEVDIGGLDPGQLLTIEWRGKPVWILRRTPEMIADLAGLDPKLADPKSGAPSQQPGYARNDTRSIKPEIMVMVGICTHLGCSPDKRLASGAAASGLDDDWRGGFFCPCHGSKFDLAGRVFKNVPAPTNLVVPPHMYLSPTRLLIGADETGVA